MTLRKWLNDSLKFWSGGSKITVEGPAGQAYNWDGDGIASENYSVNGLNQAVQASFGMISYDARGNMTSAGNRNYGYNIYNQLTNVNTSGGPLNFAVA